VHVHGARVLKLHRAVGDLELDDPRLAALWPLCAASRLPVVVHAGHHDLGTTTAADLAAVANVLSEHPNLRLVLAHLGHPAEATACELLEAHPNLYADLTPVAGAPVDVPNDVLTRHSSRLLFGSDAPNTGVSVTALVRRIVRAPLDSQQRAAILRGNAQGLLAQVDPIAASSRSAHHIPDEPTRAVHRHLGGAS
jgi:uncharacterized protein